MNYNINISFFKPFDTIILLYRKYITSYVIFYDVKNMDF